MTQQLSKRRRFLVEVLPALVYVAAIFYGGSIPLSAPRVDVGVPLDKLLHLVAFGGMQLLFVRAARYRFRALGFGRLNLLALGAVSAVGLLLELWQSTLPHRSAEALDFIADTAGGALAAGLLQILRRALSLDPTATAHSQPEAR
jgi:VanZ family protein